MKIKKGINYTMVFAGALLLFTASFLEYPEIGLGSGFILLMAGVYRISLRTGDALRAHSDNSSDESI
ncbi:hypothetical protein [Robiginitalea sp.]|uniref:hypothetical protein n=1 Tax=Robiginitalea sp. TaxID=1902411 RepID=UPI003C390971